MISDLFWNSLTLKIKNGNLFFIREFFTFEYLQLVKNELVKITSTDTDWSLVDLQENLPRRVYKPFQNLFFSHLLEHLNSNFFLEKFSNTFSISTNKISFNIWEDSSGYTLPMHVDNDAIKSSMQIYIGEGIDYNLGTSFGYDDATPFATMPYIKNTGYILTNPGEVQHGLISTVPSNFKRYSLYFYL